MSIFAGVSQAPADPILGLVGRFKADPAEKKVNLSVGAYRTEEGKPWILPSVVEAEKMVQSNRAIKSTALCPTSSSKQVVSDATQDKEYQPIDGKPEYKRPVQELIFNDDIIDSGCIATVQALSGTGSLQCIAQFLKFMGVTKVWGPNPTWGNHPKIFQRALLEYDMYPYWHQEKRGLDFEGMMAGIEKMKEGECILLHAVAHNPTGVDPTPDQWQKIVAACKERKLIPLLDNAYQGYASGELAKDGYSQKLFTESGMEFFIAQSFAKNFGLYGERIGYIHVRCTSKDAAEAVLSQLKIIVRQAYSSPPKHGAAIVNKVLTTPALKDMWLKELTFMSNRINDMRVALRKAIEAKGTPGTWNHVTDQIGMFTFTGLSKDQVVRMVEEFHIYMTGDGRISMAGLNPGNVEYVAASIDQAARGSDPNPLNVPE